MKKFAFFVVLALAAAFPMQALAQTRVKAVGTAAIHKNQVGMARDRAIDNAKRLAVEQSTRIFIQNETLVENYAVVYDRIFSRFSGYINGYKILNEKRKGDEYLVTIEAEVGTAKLKEDLDTVLKAILAEKSNPRLMVLFMDPSKEAFVAEGAMVDYFLSKGFKVVDAARVRRLSGEGRLRALGTDKSLARRVGRRYGAEILIVGTVTTSSHPFKVGEVEMFTNRAVVSARLIKSDTGDIMASASEENRLAGSRDAYEEPLQRASQKLAEKLTEKAVAWWQKELSGSTDFLLVVEGLRSYGELNRLKAVLSEETRGVRRVNQRSFEGDRAELDVQLKGKLRFLANDLVNLELGGRGFVVKRQSANTLVVRLR